MLSFEILLIISISCIILMIIFAIATIICAKKEGAAKSTIFGAIATLLSAIFSLSSYANITVPMPTILPLNNETETYIDSVEVAIKSEKAIFLETYYTLNGTDPEEDGEIYKDAINISESTTVSARNKFLFLWSDLEQRSYKFYDETMVVKKSDEESNFEEKILSKIDFEQPEKVIQQYPDNYVIVWEDKKFGQLMKEFLNKEHITYSDVKNITILNIFGDKITLNDNERDYITRYRKIDESISLNDLKYFDSLLRLRIYNFQSINCDIFEDDSFSNRLYGLDISVELNSNQFLQVSKLNNLRGLLIENNNISMDDLETLSTLENLYQLILWNDNITDISHLSNLKQLIYLDLSDNNITDISALSNLEILETVILSGNNITDYSPISHVKKIIKTPEELLKYFDSNP